MRIMLNIFRLVKKSTGLVGKFNETKSATNAAWEHDPRFAEVIRLEKLITEQQAESCRSHHPNVALKISVEHQKAIDLAG